MWLLFWLKLLMKCGSMVLILVVMLVVNLVSMFGGMVCG